MGAHAYIYRRFVAISAFALAALILATTAVARAPAPVASTITINVQKRVPVSVYGVVRADDPRCKAHRKVVVVEFLTGNTVATLQTSSTGKWRLMYKAKAPALKGVQILSALVKPRTVAGLYCQSARAGTVPSPK